MFSIVTVATAPGDEGSNGTEAAETRIGLSTSLDGPWIGTRVLELVPNASTDAGQYRGRVLRVTGSIEPEAGTTGLVDQMKNERGVRFTRLHVQSLQPTEGECAVQGTGGVERQ